MKSRALKCGTLSFVHLQTSQLSCTADAKAMADPGHKIKVKLTTSVLPSAGKTISLPQWFYMNHECYADASHLLKTIFASHRF